MTRSLAILALLTSPALAQIPLEAIPLPGYGLGVDVDGDRMAVGEGGSVLVFERVGAAWVQVDQIDAPENSEQFGASVELEGDRLAVSDPLIDNGFWDTGTVYVYDWDGLAWELSAELLPGAAVHANAEFGTALALSGDRLAATFYGDGTTHAAVYERGVGGAWSPQGQFAGSGPGLALDGNRVALGTGTVVRMLEFGGGKWIEADPILPPGTDLLQPFGMELDLLGDVLVASYSRGNSPFQLTTSVEAFRRVGVEWQHTGTVVEWSVPTAVDLDLQANRLAIGAELGGFPSTSGEEALLFDRVGSDWSLVARLTAEPPAAGYATAVALGPDLLAVATGGVWPGTVFPYDLSQLGSPFQGATEPISLSAGGSRPHVMNAGEAFAGDLYFVLGSITGTSPGISVLGVVLPLNLDPYFMLSLTQPTATAVQPSLGTLNSTGQATALLGVPTGLDPSLAGLVLSHAFLAADPVLLTATLASNAVGVALAP